MAEDKLKDLETMDEEQIAALIPALDKEELEQLIMRLTARFIAENPDNPTARRLAQLKAGGRGMLWLL
jgi:hypothetical protein